MNLYRVTFRSTEKDYTPERKYAKKVVKGGPDLKLYLNLDGHIVLMEDELKKYWDYGGGVDELKWVGIIDEERLRPTLLEPDFIDEKIRSNKNKEILGFQG